MGDACALPVGLLVPGASLERLPVRPSSSSSASAQRRAGGARLGLLETLDEVSHSNALHLQAHRPDPAQAHLPPAQRALAAARAEGYAFVATDLATPQWKHRWERMCTESGDPSSVAMGIVPSSSRPSLAGAGASLIPQPPVSSVREAELWRASPSFRLDEVHLTTSEAAPGVVLLLSPWLELDAVDEGLRLDAELALMQEVTYAAHLGASAVVLPAPSSDPERKRFLPFYARTVATCFETCLSGSSAPPAGPAMSLLVSLPITSPHELTRRLAKEPAGPPGKSPAVMRRLDDDWAWETWCTIQDVCRRNPRVRVLLDLRAPLPVQRRVLGRWASEPVAALSIPASSFMSNAKGFPVLSKAAQALLRMLLAQKPSILLSETHTPPPEHTRGGSDAYLTYIKHFVRTACAAQAQEPEQQACCRHAETLRAQLQPMLDNPSSAGYAVQEQDTVKYKLYEDAVAAALADLAAAGRARHGVRIWICGAGRGALVSRCLAAAWRSGTQVHVTAVERNPHTMAVLQDRQASEWGAQRVAVLAGDIRELLPPTKDESKADIFVADVLGSFGDNKLGPECLDGAKRFLKSNGIFIPSFIGNYLSPITSPILHAEAAGANAIPPLTGEQKSRALETPRVVHLKQVSYPASLGGRGTWPAVQPGWEFHFGPDASPVPLADTSGLPMNNSANVRTAARTFYLPLPSVVHGLAGYQEARLYGDLSLSSHPDEGLTTPGLVSYPPILFPFSTPLYCPPGAELDVHMWRMTTERRVWYEWYAEAFIPLPAAYGAASTAARTGAYDSPYPGYASPGQFDGAPASERSPSAFQNAPATPALLAAQQLDHTTPHAGSPLGTHLARASSGMGIVMSPRLSTGSATSGVTSPPLEQLPYHARQTMRIKTNMSALMNPGGRSSWLSL